MNLVDVIRNTKNAYRGDLSHYFRAVMSHARNLRNPYHNFRHSFHVMWLCHEALLYYQNVDLRILPGRARALLIAAMFHDFDHTGRTGNDDVNIELALRGIKRHILPEDQNLLPTIERFIRSTQYPFIFEPDDLCLEEKILRDADASQALSPAWIQQVIFGLASEMNVDVIDVFKMQPAFLSNLKFCTEWGNYAFPKFLLKQKLEEALGFIELLKEN